MGKHNQTSTDITLQPILLTEKQAAAYASIPLATLQRWRWAGIGLPFVKLGAGRNARVRYSVRDIQQYVEQHRRFPSVRESLERE